MLRVASISVLLWVATGCVELAGGEGEEVGTVGQNIVLDCQETGCPGNSPVVATYPIFRLPLKFFQPTAQGVVLTKVSISGLPGWTLTVSRGRITARRGFLIRTGPGLQNTELFLRWMGKDFIVKITGVVQHPMWARQPPAAPPLVEGYIMDWTEVINGVPQHEWKNVCEAAQIPRDHPVLRGSRNDLTYLPEGTYIDPTLKEEVASQFSQDQVQPACAGHLVAKTFLTGYHWASPTFTASTNARNAKVKDYACDICGTGYSFTVPKMPHDFRDPTGWNPFVLNPVNLAIEARWNEDGAYCVTKPRGVANSIPELVTAFPLGVLDAINTRCPERLLTTCDSNLFANEGQPITSANVIGP